MTTQTEYTYTPETNPNVLASMADCASPDSVDSPGAQFLVSVALSVGDAVEYDTDRTADKGETAHEVADSTVPIYTHTVWQTFTDLAAYQEDPTDLGDDCSDMTRLAMTCLYIIAERLVYALLEEEEERYEEWSENAS